MSTWRNMAQKASGSNRLNFWPTFGPPIPPERRLRRRLAQVPVKDPTAIKRAVLYGLVWLVGCGVIYSVLANDWRGQYSDLYWYPSVPPWDGAQYLTLAAGCLLWAIPVFYFWLLGYFKRSGNRRAYLLMVTLGIAFLVMLEHQEAQAEAARQQDAAMRQQAAYTAEAIREQQQRDARGW